MVARFVCLLSDVWVCVLARRQPELADHIEVSVDGPFKSDTCVVRVSHSVVLLNQLFVLRWGNRAASVQDVLALACSRSARGALR